MFSFQVKLDVYACDPSNEKTCMQCYQWKYSINEIKHISRTVGVTVVVDVVAAALVVVVVDAAAVWPCLIVKLRMDNSLLNHSILFPLSTVSSL